VKSTFFVTANSETDVQILLIFRFVVFFNCQDRVNMKENFRKIHRKKGNLDEKKK